MKTTVVTKEAGDLCKFLLCFDVALFIKCTHLKSSCSVFCLQDLILVGTAGLLTVYLALILLIRLVLHVKGILLIIYANSVHPE